MLGFEKLTVVRDVLDGLIKLLVDNGILPEGSAPTDKTLVDWIWEHVRGLKISDDVVDKMEEEYWNLLQEKREFLHIAQAFFADAVCIVRLQQSVEPLLRETAENIVVLVNTTWGLVTFFPLLLRYLKTHDDRWEEAIKTFASALIANVSCILNIDQIVTKAKEKVATSVSMEDLKLN